MLRPPPRAPLFPYTTLFRSPERRWASWRSAAPEPPRSWTPPDSQRAHGAAVQVAKRDRERVGLILPELREPGQEAPDHELDLSLLGAPVPHHRHLHLGRRVLVHLGAALPGGDDHDAPHVADHERGQGALPHEGGLHGHFAGAHLVEERLQRVVDLEQAVGKGKAGTRRDDPGALAPGNAALVADESVACDPAPGI